MFGNTAGMSGIGAWQGQPNNNLNCFCPPPHLCFKNLLAKQNFCFKNVTGPKEFLVQKRFLVHQFLARK